MKTVTFDVTYLGVCGCGFGREVSRRIEFKETQTLEDLHDAIINKSFGWDDDHLYSFFMDCKPYTGDKRMEYTRPGQDFEHWDEVPNTADVKLKDLGLKPRQKFIYIFDFGDDHRFKIRVKGFGEVERGVKYPWILESKGKAPRQY